MSQGTHTRQECARAFYEPLAASSDAARRVGWESAVAQRVRHRALVSELGPLDRVTSLCDVGCGEGALLEVLESAGFSGTYRGEDVLEAMLVRARARYPERGFAMADAWSPGPAADAIVASGTFNTRIDGDERSLALAALEPLWARARRVLVIDVAVRDRHRGGAGVASADLGELWARARELAPVVVVREDAIPGEAILALHRDRADRLGTLFPGADAARDRAELLLGGGDAVAAQRELLGDRHPRARLCHALADLQLGRVREGERGLAGLVAEPEVGPQARLHLAALYHATRRAPAAAQCLAPLLEGGPGVAEVADEARALAAGWAARAGDTARARALADAIRDPWVRREALRASTTVKPL